MRMAFSDIYEAARIANMLYFNVKRNGVAEGGLISWAKREFEDFTSTLHMKYFNLGAYPKDDFEGEFNRWVGRAREYLNKLASEMKLEQIVRPDRNWTDGSLSGSKPKITESEQLQGGNTYETCGTVYFVPTMTGDRGLIGLNFQDYQRLLVFDIKDEEVVLTIKKAKFGTEYHQQIPEYNTQVGLYTITVDGMPKPQLELSIKDIEELRKRGFKDMDDVSLVIARLPYKVPRNPSSSAEFKLDL